jgi:hypothetical protein
MTRRRLLAAAGTLLGAGLLRAQPAWPQDGVHPRATWGADLPPTGLLEAEAADDVRFLIVHHTATPNSYEPGGVPDLLRGFYRHHTTVKGWPDVAYNFFVDRFGGVWEGRAGSIDAPIKGDATGGSQGFALLCALVGDHRTEPPTPAAQAAMAALLAHLAGRYDIDPTGTTAFTSRGSNRWPEGTQVTTPTIVGHRDMSLTECPGDAAQALVIGDLPAHVAALLRAPSTSVPEPTRTPAPSPPPAPSPAPQAAPPPAADPPPPEPGVSGWLAAAAGALVAGAGAAIAAVRRAGRPESAGSGPPSGR